MKNENAKLVFIYALLGSVESCTDVTHKVPAKVYFNFPVPDLDIGDQKAVLTELKKRKIIANFKPDGGDFVISKPSRSMLRDYYFKLKDKPALKPEKPVDTKIKFDEKTGMISMRGKPCEIPINTNQYFLCKALFAEKFGTAITETDIVDMADWAKDTKRSVYDARIAVNKRIERDLGISDFIRWRTGRVRIDYKQ
ncbi:MAG: hypothetical protein WCC74_02810 [Minisyncoccia bacterium]